MSHGPPSVASVVVAVLVLAGTISVVPSVALTVLDGGGAVPASHATTRPLTPPTPAMIQAGSRLNQTMLGPGGNLGPPRASLSDLGPKLGSEAASSPFYVDYSATHATFVLLVNLLVNGSTQLAIYNYSTGFYHVLQTLPPAIAAEGATWGSTAFFVSMYDYNGSEPIFEWVTTGGAVSAPFLQPGLLSQDQWSVLGVADDEILVAGSPTPLLYALDADTGAPVRDLSSASSFPSNFLPVALGGTGSTVLLAGTLYQLSTGLVVGAEAGLFSFSTDSYVNLTYTPPTVPSTEINYFSYLGATELNGSFYAGGGEVSGDCVSGRSTVLPVFQKISAAGQVTDLTNLLGVNTEVTQLLPFGPQGIAVITDVQQGWLCNFIGDGWTSGLYGLSPAASPSLQNFTQLIGPQFLTHLQNDWALTDAIVITGTNLTDGHGRVEVINDTTLATSSFEPPPTYNLTFSRTGIPSGTGWSVTLSGTTYASVSSSITFTEPNGTYPYSVSPIPGYSTTYSGHVTVNGTSALESVTFTPLTYTVTISESGLPLGTGWSVTVNGTTNDSTGPSIAFLEPNGTYAFDVGAISGYTVTPAAGNLTVRGASLSQALTFSSSGGGGPSSGFLGLSGNTGYYVLGGLIAAVLVGVGVAVILRTRRR